MMESIELSNQQASKRSYSTTLQFEESSTTTTAAAAAGGGGNTAAEHLSVRHVFKEDGDDEDNMTANSHTLLSEEESRINMPSMTNNNIDKKTFTERLKAKIPPVPLIRTVVKASFALLIALIITFADKSRNAIGQGIILVPIGTILHFPVRPLGVQIEATIQGLFGALVGSAWCMLGMYLGNLARDPGIATPVQPNSSAVLAVFMFIGVFGLTYVRIKFAQANFACIFASMIVAFALTQASVTPGFQPVIVYTFLIPIALSAGIALLVDALIWPDDSITKYMAILNVSLQEYNSFFQEHSNAFLSVVTDSPAAMTLPSLHARLQNSILKLIDCKREVQREILFNRLAHDDINNITRLVKTMLSPLHGIGLSLITKAERLEQVKQPYFAANTTDDQNEHKKQFMLGLEELRKVSQELTDTCVMTLGECNERLMKFGGRPRSLMSTIFWPFPRIFPRDYYNNSKREDSNTRIQSLSERLDQVILKYKIESKKMLHIFIEPGADSSFEARFNGLLQIIYLFQYNLMEHALQLRSLVACVENIEATRTTKKLWLPHLKLRKWFRSLNVNANLGGPVGTAETGGPGVAGLGNDLTLCQTMTSSRPDNAEQDQDIELVCRRNRQGKAYPRDPDANPPETAFENFFYRLHKIVHWSQSVEAAFAFKTSAGFTLLSLPAFLAGSAAWFFAWRGQWATITLMLWMFPMAGMFFFTVILRVVGTILGGVAGIIVWEITRGNPYGLAVLMFFIMLPLNYIFFTSQIMNIVAILTQVTLILVVIMEYTYVVGGAAVYDSIEIVAGKRMMLVIIGVAAAAILAIFPKAVTGRVELRKRISRTIHDLSKLYGILVGDLLATNEISDAKPTSGQRKAFRKLALGIRRQIADEQTFLKLTKLEPPLRGKFPLEEYTRLVEKIDNMADLLQGMAFASRSIDKTWKRKLVRVIEEERMEYLASILSIMKLLSATLVSKMALPPFMLSPTELRLRLARKMSEAITKYPENLDNETFPSYCAFAVNSFKFSGELAEVMECIENLVGVEDPQQWLLLNA